MKKILILFLILGMFLVMQPANAVDLGNQQFREAIASFSQSILDQTPHAGVSPLHPTN